MFHFVTVGKVAVSVKVLILSHLQPLKIHFVALLFLLNKFLSSFRAYLIPFTIIHFFCLYIQFQSYVLLKIIFSSSFVKIFFNFQQFKPCPVSISFKWIFNPLYLYGQFSPYRQGFFKKFLNFFHFRIVTVTKGVTPRILLSLI